MRLRIIYVLLMLAVIAGTPTAAAAQPATKKNQAPPAAEPQNPDDSGEKLSLDTTQVLVNVTVTDTRENYVAGLKASDFQVFEDRQPQRIVSFSRQETPFAAVLLLDTSGSMGPKMSLARAACAQFASRIREGDVVAIYGFGGAKVKKIQDFTEVRDVDPVVWEVDADGETPLYDAVVQAAEDLAKREERRRAMIIISDGADTRSRASLDQALREAHAANITIYAVDLSDAGLGRGPARDNGASVLREMAAKSGGRFFTSPGGGKLRDAFEQTVEELRNQYTLAYEPAGERRDGRWHAIEVKVAREQLKVRARQGYYAPKASAQK